MPTYDYKCGECDYIAEIKHPMLETAESLGLECGECGSSELEKLLSVPLILISDTDTGPSCSTCPTTSCPAGSCSLTGDY